MWDFWALPSRLFRSAPIYRLICRANVSSQSWSRSGRSAWTSNRRAHRCVTEDPRYAALRGGWGASAAWQMWLLVQKQAVVSIPLVLAIFLAAHNPAPTLRLQDGLAILIFILAITGEGVADQQLRRFRRSSSGGRRDLPIRIMALVAASELFLRMVRLGRVSACRHRPIGRLRLGVARSSCAGLHVLAPRVRLRHSAP